MGCDLKIVRSQVKNFFNELGVVSGVSGSGASILMVVAACC